MRELSHALDVSTLLSTPDTFNQAINSGHDFDLVILDTTGITEGLNEAVDAYLTDNGMIPLLLIVDEDKLSTLRIPVQFKTDFILSTASEAEFEVRISQLLWPGEESVPSDVVSIDNMTINLATYQGYIDDAPVDLTLMEYSLLSFLATHPSRAYSRDTLLHRVWGFEYCGGTRTVEGGTADCLAHHHGPRRRLPLQALVPSRPALRSGVLLGRLFKHPASVVMPICRVGRRLGLGVW